MKEEGKENSILQDLIAEQSHQAHIFQELGYNPLILKLGHREKDIGRRLLIVEKKVQRPHTLLKIGHNIIMSQIGHIILMEKVGQRLVVVQTKDHIIIPETVGHFLIQGKIEPILSK